MTAIVRPARTDAPFDKLSFVASVVGLALFMCALWSVKNSSSSIPDYVRFFSRILKGVVVLAMAFAYRRLPPDPRPTFFLGAACLALHTGFYTAFYACEPTGGAAVALGLLSGLFAAIGEGIVMVMLLHALTTFPPKAAAVGFALAYVLNETLFLLALGLPSSALIASRPVAKVLSAVLLAVVLVRKSRGFIGMQERRMRFDVEEPPGVAVGTSAPLEVLVTGQLVFIVAFDLVEQAGRVGHIASGIYDVPSELMAVGTFVLLLVVLVCRRGLYPFVPVLASIVFLASTGCVLNVIFYERDFLVGVLLFKAAYSAFLLLRYIEVARACYQLPQHAYLNLCVVYGSVVLLNALCDLGFSAAIDSMGEDVWLSAASSAIAVWVLGAFGLAMLCMQHAALTAPVAETSAHGASRPQMAPDWLAATYNLTPRECEVLGYVLRGYTMTAAGDVLGISAETVKTHLRHVYQKVGVASKQELVSFIDNESRLREPDAEKSTT